MAVECWRQPSQSPTHWSSTLIGWSPTVWMWWSIRCYSLSLTARFSTWMDSISSWSIPPTLHKTSVPSICMFPAIVKIQRICLHYQDITRPKCTPGVLWFRGCVSTVSQLRKEMCKVWCRFCQMGQLAIPIVTHIFKKKFKVIALGWQD